MLFIETTTNIDLQYYPMSLRQLFIPPSIIPMLTSAPYRSHLDSGEQIVEETVYYDTKKRPPVNILIQKILQAS